MKRRLITVAALIMIFALVLPLGASAMIQPPSGAEYGMGSRATVFYNGRYYDRQTVYLSADINPLVCQICEDTGWEIQERDDRFSITGQFRFINGKIYNTDYPDGVEGYDWLLTEEEYAFELGRYEAFRRQVPQAMTGNFIAFDDFPTYEDEWYTAGMLTAVREGFFIGNKVENAEREIGYKCYLKPESTMTRAEVVTTIMRTVFPKVREYDGAYSDIKSGDWYASYIIRAYESGLIGGEGDLFSPNSPATREFTAKILANVMNVNAGGEVCEFPDSGQVADDCADGVNLLVLCGIISGYPDNTFRPKNTITRAEYGVMLGGIINKGLLSVDTVNEAFANEYAKALFETYPNAQERLENEFRLIDANISYPFYGK